MDAKNILGYKLFKEDSNGIHMIRIVGVKQSSSNDFSTLTIYDYDNNQSSKILLKDISGYTPLEPDGIFTASVVHILDGNNKKINDVICTANKYIMFKAEEMPYAVCRQCVTDVFNEMFLEGEVNNLVGMSMNKDDCPAGFDFRLMMAADEVDEHVFVNFYRNDTVNDILNMVPKFRFTSVLSGLYQDHIKHKNDPKLIMGDYDDGWCTSIDKLLEVNNFQADIDQMFGITSLGFDIDPYILYKPIPGNEDVQYGYLSDDIRYWLSSIYNINIKEANIIEYDHDINMADYNNSTYFLFRDSKNKLYLVVYTTEGEYLESDLEAKAKEYDFSTKFRLKFYNKYNHSNDNIIQD